MHLPRKKEQNPADEPHPAWPTHSELRNPYPLGLEPVVLDDGLPGSNDLAQALAKAEPSGPGCISTDEYLYVQPDENFPRLRLHLGPRGKRETDEQYANYRRGIEEFTCTHAIYLGLCQELCTLLGNHHTCAQGACRRNGGCSAIRDQDRFDLPILVFPPCVPLDREIIETYRQEIVAELRRIVARGQSRG